VDIDFSTPRYSHKTPSHQESIVRDLEAWKRYLVEVLRDSPSKERKFLRWRVREHWNHGFIWYTIDVEEGELEVLPETSL